MPQKSWYPKVEENDEQMTGRKNSESKNINEKRAIYEEMISFPQKPHINN